MLKDNAFIKVLKIGPFRNLWLSQLLSQVFLNLLFFSLMIRIYDLTHSNSAVSLMVLIITIPNILLAALAGVLVDRGERKVVMFLSHFLRVFIVLAFLLSTETLGWLYILMLLISTITQFFFPAEAATIHELVTNKKLLLTANSLFTVTFFISVIVGNVLAGPFLTLFGTQITFLLVAGAFLLAAFFTAQLPGITIRDWLRKLIKTGLTKKWEETLGTWKGASLFSDLLTGLDHIYKTAAVKRAILVIGASQITIGSLGTIAPGFADTVLHIATVNISIYIMAPAALGMILGAVCLGQFLRRTSRDSLIRNGLMVLAVGVLSYSVVDIIARFTHLPLFVVSVIILVLLGAANSFLDVPSNTTIQENTPEEVRSRVYGVVNTIVGLGAIVPIVLSGVFADIIGVRAVMIIIGVALGVFMLKARLVD